MDHQTLFFNSPRSKISQIFTSNSKIFIKNTEGINVIDLKTKKSLLIIPNNDWSNFDSIFSEKLNSLICFSSNKMGIEIYKGRDSTSSCFKIKPKKYVLDDRIKEVRNGLIYFENDQIPPFQVDGLLSIDSEEMNDTTNFGNSSVSNDNNDPENKMTEIFKFLKIQPKIYSKNLIHNKYLCYFDKNNLKLTDVDFQETIFDEEIDSKINLIYSFGSFVIYANEMNECFIRGILPQENTTLARLIKKSNTKVIPSASDIYKNLENTVLNLNLPNIKSLKTFLLGEFKNIDKQKFNKHLKNNVDITQLFQILEKLFEILESTTFINNNYFFEELINLISILIDAKLFDLLLISEKEVENKFEKLKIATEKQENLIRNLTEVDTIISELIETKEQVQKEEKRYGNMPAPWDEYSVQVLDI